MDWLVSIVPWVVGTAGVVAIIVGPLVFVPNIIHAWSHHQQKVLEAEGNVSRQEIDEVRQELREIKELLHQQAIILDDLSERRYGDEVRTRLESGV